jgi:WD40 repeat protein
MAEGPQESEFQASREQQPLDYDAFLSYTHSDRPVAGAIQKGLHSIGRRLGQLRALRIFRDDTDLEANPDLWGRITDAMDRARYMIVVLSPKAAESYWVNKEVSHWLKRWGRDQVLLVLVDGELQWNADEQRFDPAVSDAAPPVLTESGSLPSDPLYIDVSPDLPWDPSSPAFRDKVTALAAPIHGKPKSHLASDDLREQRRFRRLRAAAITGLALLTVIAVVAAAFAFTLRREAVRQRQAALRQRDEAVALRLVDEAQHMIGDENSTGGQRAFQELIAAHVLATESGAGGAIDNIISRINAVKTVRAPLSKGGRHGNRSDDTVVAFSPDGHRIAWRGDDMILQQISLQLWDAVTSVPVPRPPLTRAISVAFSPDWHRLASGGDDNMVRLWETDTGRPLGAPLTGHTAKVISVAFSPDGHRLASGSEDKTVRLWNADTGQPIGAPLTGNTDPVSSVTFSPDSHRLATSSEHSSVDSNDFCYRDCDEVRLWNADTGQPLGAPLKGMTVVSFSPDGRRLALSSGHAEQLQLWSWNADTGKLTGTPVTVANASGPTAVFSRDWRRVAWVDEGQLNLGNVDTGRAIGGPLTGAVGAEVEGVAFSPDGHRLASSGYDVNLQLWNADTGQPFGLPLPTGDVSVAFSPDGQWLVSSNRYGKVSLTLAISAPQKVCDTITTNMSHKQWHDWISPDIPYITLCPGLPIASD